MESSHKPRHWLQGILPLGLIIAIYLSLATAYNVLQPIGEAPDEPAHVEYVQFVQQHGHPPVGDPNAPAHLDPLAPGIEFDQMPLYYLIEAAILRPIWLPPGTFLHRNPFVGWPNHPWSDANLLHRTDEGWPYHGFALLVHAGRLISTLFGFLTILATYGLIRSVTAARWPGLFGTAWVAWNPSFLQTSSHLTNDAAVVAFSTLTLFMCARLLVRRRASPTEVMILSVSLAAAVLSKLNSIALGPVAFVTVVYSVGDSVAARQGRRLWQDLSRRIAAAILAVLLPILALVVWWLAYGQSFATRLGVTVGFGVAQISGLERAISPDRIREAVFYLNDSLWSEISPVGTLAFPAPVYLALALPLVVFVAAGVSASIQGCWSVFSVRGDSTFQPRNSAPCQLRPTTEVIHAHQAAVVLLLSAIPSIYATVTRQAFPWVGLDANARFIQPVLPVIALILTFGGLYAIRPQFRPFLAVGYLTVILTVSIAQAVYLFPQIPAPRIPARLAQTPIEAVQEPQVTFDNGVDLLGVEDLPNSLIPGKSFDVTLRWSTDHTPTENFVAYTHLIDQASQTKVGGSKDATPFDDSFPPTLWQHGEIVDQTLTVAVPANLQPGKYDLQFGMYDARGQKIQTVSRNDEDHASVVTLDNWLVLPDASGKQTAKPSAVHFGDSLQLVAYKRQLLDNQLHVTLYWTADRPLSQNLTVSVQILDALGHLITQQDSEPVAGELPTSVWPSGVAIRDDHQVFVDRPEAGAHVVVIVYDHQTMARLSAREVNTPLHDYFDLGPLDATPNPDGNPH